MLVKDSRRLTGPNLISETAGAVLDIALNETQRDRAAAAWQQQMDVLLEGLGWSKQRKYVRFFHGGMSLVISAPPDALYAATEINEHAWELALAELDGHSQAPNKLADLRAQISQEANPSLLELYARASARGVTCLSDDDQVSLGLGTGSQTWPVRQIPAPETIDWSRIHDIPSALITGTNGKSTTVRLLAHMTTVAGLTPGLCSTDWIAVGPTLIDHGDYSGPGGARTLLRDRRVQIALLETARGGILRRGLALNRVRVALVTNVAEDHLGEYGIFDLQALTQVKLVVSRAVERDGYLVVNADDKHLAEAATRLPATKFWFSLEADNPVLQDHAATGGSVCFVEQGRFTAVYQGQKMDLGSVVEAPLTLGGAARHNTANALAAIAVALTLGLDHLSIRTALMDFRSTAASNPGRCNLYHMGGVTVLVDFAHNPHGMAALVRMAAAMKAERRLILLGQAGDRDDEAIGLLARTAWATRPDCMVIKEMAASLRGRALGEVPALIKKNLLLAGAPAGRIRQAPSESEAVKTALDWARPGDLLLLLLHENRSQTLTFIEQLCRDQWRPGEPLPEPTF